MGHVSDARYMLCPIWWRLPLLCQWTSRW